MPNPPVVRQFCAIELSYFSFFRALLSRCHKWVRERVSLTAVCLGVVVNKLNCVRHASSPSAWNGNENAYDDNFLMGKGRMDPKQIYEQHSWREIPGNGVVAFFFFFKGPCWNCFFNFIFKYFHLEMNRNECGNATVTYIRFPCSRFTGALYILSFQSNSNL